MTAPTSAAPARPAFGHEGLLYRDRAGFLDGTVPFVRAGLRAGEPVLVAVPGDRIGPLRHALGAEAGAVRFLDMAEAGRNPNRIIPWVLRAFVDEFAGRAVRIVGEPIWPGRPPEEIPLCVRLEALINVALAGTGATVLCPYDACLHAGVLLYARRTHPVLVDGGRRGPHPGYADPDDVVALLNQPLPEPTVPVTELAFDRTGTAGVRDAVAAVAGRAGLAPARVVDLQLAVDEVATGAVVDPAGYGHFRGWQRCDRVLCEIRSDGHLAGWTAHPVGPAADSRPDCGLSLADRLCDLVETYTQPAGTTTRLHMCLPRHR